MNKAVRASICRIDVLQDGKGVSRGTGTLVAPGIVLTALHVVADRRSNPPTPYPGRITLTFPDHQTEAVIHETFLDAGADWVLLQCKDTLPLDPIPVGWLKQSGLPWETYGFPDANPRDGMVQTGTVESFDGNLEGAVALQLFSNEAAAGDGAPVKGLSGAPVIVNGWLVGHMRFALMQDGRTVAGTLYACPVSTVGEVAKGLITVNEIPLRRSTATTILGEVKSGERRTRLWLLAGMIAVAGAVAAAFWLMPSRPARIRPPIQLLGVLPFVNMTGGNGQAASLGEGMRGVIFVELRRIRSLRVIDLANLSLKIMGTGQAAGPDLKAAGIGAQAVLKGQILPSGTDDARVRLVLLEADTDGSGWTPTWQESYDVHGRNAFEIQQEVAREIAGELEARLTARDSVLLATAHTGDSSAAEFFLVGKSLLDQAFFDRDAAQRAAIMFSRSVGQDPGFAIAYARLSDAHSLIYFLGVDQSDTRRRQALAAADTALALHPDLPEAHFALGAYHYRITGQNQLALHELSIVEQSLPHDAKLQLLQGLVRRRMDDWSQAICHLRRAAELEPGNWATAYYTGQSYFLIRDYAGAARYLDRAITDSVESGGLDQRARAFLTSAALSVAANGDTAAARALLLRVKSEFSRTALLTAISLDEFRPLLRLVSTPGLDSLFHDLPIPPSTDTTDYLLARAILARRANRPVIATSFYLAAAAESRARIGLDPLAVEPRYDQASALAGLGRFEEATRAIQDGIALLEEGGKLTGSRTVGTAVAYWTAAEVYAQAGRKAAALDMIERLFEVPSYLSPDWVRVDPLFAPLQSLPGYHEMKQAFFARQVAPLFGRGGPSSAPCEVS